MLSQRRIVFLFAIPLCMVGIASGQIYRMNGQLISGTEDIVLGPGVDLSGWDLGSGGPLNTAANLSGFDFTGADLSGANLWGANVTGSNFTDADLSDASLIGVDSSNVNFDGADLSGADMDKAFFRSSDFSNANLRQANLAAGFSNVKFIGASFQETDLWLIAIDNSNLGNADLTSALNLDNPIWVFGSNYNQWTRLPDDFQSANNPLVDLTLRESPVGDFDASSRLNLKDIDSLSRLIRTGSIRGFAPMVMYDVSNDGVVDLDDHRMWIQQLKKTWYGDANLDGEFNSTDLIAVFTAAQYEDAIDDNSGWSTGDWNADGDFTTSDLVVAFQESGYDAGRRTNIATVPEPQSLYTALLGLITAMTLFRRRVLGPASLFKSGFSQHRICNQF